MSNGLGFARTPVRDRPVRAAIVGAGAFGRLHARAFAARDDVELAAVVDTDVARARAVADEAGALAAASLDDVLVGGRLDAVSVVVGGAGRVELAEAALEAGCAVLVEKPVATTAAGARRLAARAERTGEFVMPAHILRFAEPYRAVHDRVRSGETGPVARMEFHRHRGADHDRRFADVHPVLMTMVHDIDLAIWLGGPTPSLADAVVTATAVREPGRAQPAAVQASVTWPGGPVWEFDVSWRLGPEDDAPDVLRVEGPTGAVGLDLGDLRRVGVTGIGPESAWLAPPDGGGALGAEVAEFVTAVRTGTLPTTVSIDDAVRGLELAEAVIAAARTAAAVGGRA
ncbi:MAG: Gfo/Idh/MocA family protein [Actinomycetota bacterium]